MAKHARPRLTPQEAFLKAWSSFGQDLADFTGEPTILVRDTTGVARFAILGYPLDCGDLLATFQPRPRERAERTK